MLCQELMKRDVQCVSPHDSVTIAARKMRDTNVGFLPVVNEHRHVLGAITDRDIAVRLVAEGLPATTTVGDIMTHEVVACDWKEDVHVAEQLMGERRKSRVICVDEFGTLQGVISFSDVAQSESDKRTAQTIRRITEREVYREGEYRRAR